MLLLSISSRNIVQENQWNLQAYLNILTLKRKNCTNWKKVSPAVESLLSIEVISLLHLTRSVSKKVRNTKKHNWILSVQYPQDTDTTTNIRINERVDQHLLKCLSKIWSNMQYRCLRMTTKLNVQSNVESLLWRICYKLISGSYTQS